MNTERKLSLNAGKAVAVAFSPEGNYVAASNGEGLVQLWRVDNPTTSKRFRLSGQRVEALLPSPGAERMIVAGGGNVVVMRTTDGKVVQRLHAISGNSLTLSADGRCLAYPTSRKKIVFYRLP